MNSENSLLILPPEILTIIGLYLPKNSNSHINALFNLSLSCKFLFNVLSPIILHSIESLNDRFGLETLAEDENDRGKNYFFAKTELPLLSERIRAHTQIYKITLDLQLIESMRDYFPRFRKLSSLSLNLMTYGLDRSEDELNVVSIYYPVLFDFIRENYYNLRKLDIEKYVWCAESCRILTSVLKRLTNLRDLSLNLSHTKTQISEFDLIPFAWQISKLNYLEKFHITCYSSLHTELQVLLFLGLAETPVSYLSFCYHEKLQKPVEEALAFLINDRNLSVRRFEKFHMVKTYVEVRQSFSIPSQNSTPTSEYVPIKFGNFYTDWESDFTDFSNLESFYFGSEVVAEDENEYPPQWVNSFLLAKLSTSSKLTFLKWCKLHDIFDLLVILWQISSLDHLSISLSGLKDFGEMEINLLAGGIKSCTSRRRLKSLTIQSYALLGDCFFDYMLQTHIKIDEVIIDAEVLPLESYYDFVERCFAVEGGTEKKKVSFPQSRVYEEVVFDSKEHVLKLKNMFCKKEVSDLFPQIMNHVHRVVLDNVKDEVVDHIMTKNARRFDKMKVTLGMVENEYCLYQIR